MSYMMVPDERVYLQVTHPWAGEVPNSAGSATVGNNDACRHIACDMRALGDVIQSRAKTGSRSRLSGLGGRRGASFSLEVPLMGSGAAGTAPDCAPILEAIFGQTGQVSAGVSVTYELADTVPELIVWSFRTPDGTDTWQRVLFGGVVGDFEITPNQDGEATLRVNGAGEYVVNKPKFASLDTTAKGGLTSFPSEPSAPVFNGVPALGFTGSATINGVGSFKLSDFRISGNLNRLLRPAHGSYYPNVPVQGQREITLDLSLYEENSSDMSDLRHLLYSKETFDATLVIGDTAGNIWTFTCNDMQLPGVEEDEGQAEYVLRLNGCPMAATSTTDKDEFKLVCT